MKLTSAQNVYVYMYGGNSRSNASITVADNNQSLSLGLPYIVDVSAGAVVLVLPYTNQSSVSFTFEYYVTGTEYNFWEKLVVGPHGETYFIVGLACGSAIVLSILIGVICCIVRCCRREEESSQKVQVVPKDTINDSQRNLEGPLDKTVGEQKDQNMFGKLCFNIK